MAGGSISSKQAARNRPLWSSRGICGTGKRLSPAVPSAVRTRAHPRLSPVPRAHARLKQGGADAAFHPSRGASAPHQRVHSLHRRRIIKTNSSSPLGHVFFRSDGSESNNMSARSPAERPLCSLVFRLSRTGCTNRPPGQEPHDLPLACLR